MWFMMLPLSRSLATIVVMTMCAATWTLASPFPTDPQSSSSSQQVQYSPPKSPSSRFLITSGASNRPGDQSSAAFVHVPLESSHEQSPRWSIPQNKPPSPGESPHQHENAGTKPSDTSMTEVLSHPFYPGQADATHANGNGGPVDPWMLQKKSPYDQFDAYPPRGPPDLQSGRLYPPPESPSDPAGAERIPDQQTKRMRLLRPSPIQSNPPPDNGVGFKGRSRATLPPRSKPGRKPKPKPQEPPAREASGTAGLPWLARRPPPAAPNEPGFDNMPAQQQQTSLTTVPPPLTAQFSSMSAAVGMGETVTRMMQEGTPRKAEIAPFKESWNGLIAALQDAAAKQRMNLDTINQRLESINRINDCLTTSIYTFSTLKVNIDRAFINYRQTIKSEPMPIPTLVNLLRSFDECQSHWREAHLLKDMLVLHETEIRRTANHIDSYLKKLDFLEKSLSKAAHLFAFKSENATTTMLADMGENTNAAATRSATANEDAVPSEMMTLDKLQRHVVIRGSAEQSIQKQLDAPPQQRTAEELACELKYLEAKNTLLQSELKYLELKAKKGKVAHSKPHNSLRTMNNNLFSDLLSVTDQIETIDLRRSPPKDEHERMTLIEKFHVKLHKAIKRINSMVDVIIEAEVVDRQYQAEVIIKAHVKRLSDDISRALSYLEGTMGVAFRKAGIILVATQMVYAETRQPLLVPTPDEAREVAEKWFQNDLSQQKELLHDLGGSMFIGWPPAQDSTGIALHVYGGEAPTVGTLSHEYASEAPTANYFTRKAHPLHIDWSLVRIPLMLPPTFI
ncbi:hypothetical protein CXG81DRAFT_20889 [Caulochytrium protostelioides]|uniref:Uncharacterized protein n=1 Tax=Caulochytrium protostelioides TaxID=1555241 RepID=A0A4P9X2N0_9FUNG|nr:hypothetical protein CXG81DRAFT_20889 [Caulochytrium protostelioides]|eukprot:RKO98960.1 hypothetical protein CXG81DRAFT_20889 [Caulochytrium protostelioides]